MVGVALWLLKTPAGGRSNYVTPVTTAFSVAVAAAIKNTCSCTESVVESRVVVSGVRVLGIVATGTSVTEKGNSCYAPGIEMCALCPLIFNRRTLVDCNKLTPLTQQLLLQCLWPLPS